MISLTSNLNKVIGQVESLKAEVPRAIARALLPSKWIERAREVAEVTLMGLAGADQREYVGGFVRAVSATVFNGTSLRLSLTNPRPRLREVLSEAQSARAATSPASVAESRGLDLFARTVTEFEQLILDWVQTAPEDGGKLRDARDDGKTDEEIAHLISYIMLSPQLGEQGRQARDALLPHIVQFLQAGEAARVGLTAETIDLWLRAVLAAWRNMVRDELAQRIRAELKAKKFP